MSATSPPADVGTATPAADRAPDWVAGGTPETLRSQLHGVLDPETVLTRALDLVKYASDASPYRLIPQAVVMPRNTHDVAMLFDFARETGTPLTFRAGGTSLNGQAQSDSVLVDCRRHWHRVKIEDQGARVRVQPGVVLGYVNRLLARYGRKLGPDPASTDIACVGGVIANNSGGMRCGVAADSYQTVKAMKLVLANGAEIDTEAPDAEQQFARAAPDLAYGLLTLRDELRGDPELAERVARKFEIKNTTGYRLCAFLDADSPLEIFRRLVIGSEGTLAFVAEAVYETVPLGRHTSISLVLFEDIDAATGAVPALVAVGATATELMVAPTLIAAAYNMPGTPAAWKEMPPSAAALLVEFRADQEEALEQAERAALELLERHPVIELGGEPASFTRELEEIEMHWRVREGMQGLLAAMRPPGAQLIIEDVCVRPERIAECAKDLQALLGKHGFLQGVAGHASVGNLHFLLTPNFGEPADLERYDMFMHELVELIVEKYDGSLKAEHGTGLNMAPFVEREWGPKATELMRRLKHMADPWGMLGPGVVLNSDPQVHLKNLKGTPEIEKVATTCIECGFCEPVCPSRNVTTTPRQRIVLRREMARQAPDSPVLEALRKQYRHDAVDTCAADGSCMHACPVGIDTGKLVKGLRAKQHGSKAERAGAIAARQFGLAERAARVGVGPARSWRHSIPPPAPGGLPATRREGAAAVYMPACINRIFGNPSELGSRPTVPEALVVLSTRAGFPVWIPEDVTGRCCGTPWSSKGFRAGHEQMAKRMREDASRWTDGGRLPLVLDASSCSHGLISEAGLDGVEVLDSIAWVHDHLMARLEPKRKLARVAVHPNCSAAHLGLHAKLGAIAEAIADEVVVPAASGCCGMAGDRGWLHPELTASALRDLAAELDGQSFDACVSSNRTCEAALSEATGKSYASFLLVLEEVTRA